ncbi:MAG: ATP-grasp domain-containing protein [Actinophytocola sp.]|uniref:ATP-grasp domain-containing protein n=1 Tax=Actinophytocola sp. TaxID=1872138 RepID=UPI003D6ACA11
MSHDVPTGRQPSAGAGGRPRILVVGGQPKQVRKAHELGLDVVYAQFPNKYGSEHWPYVEQALLLDYADVDRLVPLARALHEAYPFRTAVTLSEFGLLSTARVNEALDLDGESVEVAELLMDKWRMRQHLAAKGVSPVASAVGRTTQDVRDFVEEHGLPIIVKPTRESGSLAVYLVDDPAGVDTIANQFLSLVDKEWAEWDVAFEDTFDQFLMEEYLDGPEVSVESLSFDGRHVIIAITDYVKSSEGFAEIGMWHPSGYPAETQREITELVTDFLDAVGLRNGPAHTEVKLTTRGPRIVESHNRIGGYAINEMVEVVYGVDMELYALGAGLDVIEPLTTAPEPRCGVALQALMPVPGRVVEVTGVDAVRADPDFVAIQVKVKPGDVVAPLTWNEDIGGYVVARGADAKEAIANCERLVAAIDVRTEPVA